MSRVKKLLIGMIVMAFAILAFATNWNDCHGICYIGICKYSKCSI